MDHYLNSELKTIQEQGRYRTLKVSSELSGRELFINGRRCLNFSSNNYLGLSFHPAVKQAAHDAVQRYGCGGTSSRLIAGTFEAHVQLEEGLARRKGTEAALAFPSGFQANAGILPVLAGGGDCVIMDRLNHASLWDAAKISGARLFAYHHRDMGSVETILRRAREYRRKIIVTDSLFSMDGDIAPLAEFAALAHATIAWTMIDEAHATGVFGEHGHGCAEQCGVEARSTSSWARCPRRWVAGRVRVRLPPAHRAAHQQKQAVHLYDSLAPASAAAAWRAADRRREPERRRAARQGTGAARAPCRRGLRYRRVGKPDRAVLTGTIPVP